MNHDKKPTPVAIIGIGCLFPKAPGHKEYWRLLYHGESAIREVPETHWNARDYYAEKPKTMDHTYCTRGGYLSAVSFNPAEFGIPPNVLEATDTSQLLGLVATRMALEDAGYGKNRDYDRSRVSVMIGATVTQELVIPLGARLGHPKWRKALEDSGIPPEKTQEVVERISDSYVAWQENSFPGLLGNVISGRIANRFDFGGTNTSVDAACASSFSALNLAFMELQTGRSNMVVSGGSDTLNDIFMHMCFAQTGVLSFTGNVNAFSENADGTVLGEGIGILILKLLPDAEKDGDKIYAVIKSIGSSSDGKSLSVYAPSAKGQAKAIERAYREAGISPETVELVEAHGTGTRGDVVEFDGIKEHFTKYSDKKNWCGIGTVKSNIGHTKAAAGVAGLIKGILSLYHKVMPPTLNISKPDPKLNIKESPFYLLTQSRPWVKPDDHPRRCGVTASGFGGSNFHIILEEYDSEKTTVSWNGSVEILAFSGQTEKDILNDISLFKKSTDTDKPLYECDALFRYHAAQSRIRFKSNDPARLLLLITTDEKPLDIIEKAVSVISSIDVNSFEKQNMMFSKGSPPEDRKLAFLFPGQGSQFTQMGKDLVSIFPEARELIEKTNKCLGNGDIRLSDIMYPLPDHIIDTKESEERLRKTDKAQPAIGAVSLSMDKILKRFGITPQAVCGHSFGELTALCSAGWINEDDFLSLAVSRGRFMASCGENAGTMLAAMAPLDKIEQLIKESGIPVILANRNSYEQGVLSGSFDAIEKADALCRENGIRTAKLPVAAAFHSSLVEAAARPFSDEVKKFALSPTLVPVYSNTTGNTYPEGDIEKSRELLGNQLLNPVNFVADIENLYQSGVRMFIEVGPKSVLSGLVKAILNNRPSRIVSIDASSGKKSGIFDLARTLCTLAADGYPVKLAEWEDAIEMPQKQGMSIPICGANYRAPVTPRPKSTFIVPQPVIPTAEIPVRHTAVSDGKVSKPVSMEVNPVKGFDNSDIKHHQTANPVSQKTVLANTQPGIVTDALKVVQEGLRSMQAIQAQTADAHNRFLQAQAEAGKTLQAIMEKAQAMFRSPVTGPVSSMGVHEDRHHAPLIPSATAPIRTPEKTVVPFSEKQPPKAMDTHQAKPVFQSAPVKPAVKQVNFRKNIEKHMIDVVSELTGYPAEMIGLDMDIEADLGIDSIKRVEILSTFEERVSDLPTISPEAMSTIKTLGEIIDYLSESQEDEPVPSLPTADKAAQNMPGSSVNKTKLTSVMLNVVSELTGYPVEMIGLDMDIEADLGIDSIKRVEIMSSFEEKMQDLPQISPEAMSTIKTLGEIIDYVCNNSIVSMPSGPVASKLATPAIDMKRLTSVMLDVVSELTGYPVDMIGLDMDIEADLGIDSIKRVEIMSAFEERVSDLPAISPDAMSTIKTLGEILAYVAESGTSSGSSVQQSTPSSTSPVADMSAITAIMLNVVSELTGYPVDMIGLDMDIEADLGIDSIKRVEIMSAFEERMPDLPAVSPDAMAVLKTLGEIVAYVAKATTPVPTDTVSQNSIKQTQTTVDMKQVTHNMLEVVSKLTGYPVDMIGLDMDIEADLGIDSIKRVEIMSEFESLMPGLPSVDPEVMGGLKTLNQICGYISSATQTVQAPTVPSETMATGNKPEQRKIPATVNRQIVVVERNPLNTSRPVSIPDARKIYVTDDKSGLSAAIVSELRARKLHAALINLNDKTPDAAGLVIIPDFRRKKSGTLANLTGFKKKDHDIWDKSHEDIIKASFSLASRTGSDLVQSSLTGGAFFATITRQDGAFGFNKGKLISPVLGGLSGLAKTAALEWEKVNCKAMDVEPSAKSNENLACRIVDELLHHGAGEVGFTETERITLCLKSTAVETGNISLEQKDVVIVSGGAKGVTAAAAIALAKKVSPTVVLLGRSPEPGPEPGWLKPLTKETDIKKAILEHEFKGQKTTPAQIEKSYKTHMGNREVSSTIEQLKKSGANTAYFSADVRDLGSVSKVIEEVKAAFGPVKALIHGAGVLEDRFIVDQTPEQFDKVYSTKVNGLETLLKAIPSDDLKYLVLFSSVSARIGNTGQVAYAMANEVLNKVGRAFAEQNPQCHVVSINWGPWDGGMVTASLKKEFAKKNVELIPIDEGAECMVREMSGPKSDPIEVVIGGTFPTPGEDVINMKPVIDIIETHPPVQPAKHLTLSFKKEVDTRTYPILQSHIIKEKPVVPFALMTEWFGHGALHKNPGFVLHGLDGMRVLKGIKIENEPRTIRIMSGKLQKKDSFYEVELEIRNGNKEHEHVHSKAKAILSERLPEAPAYTIPAEILAQPYKRNVEEAYGQILFHGPELKGIRQIKGCSPKGMVAEVASAPSPSSWISDPLRTNWVSDPLVIDSAYQMAILWCYEEKGLVSLPSYCESYRQYTREFPHDGLTVVMEVKDISDHKIKSDFTFLNRQDKVVATINGYEAVMDASLISSFGKGGPSEDEVPFDREKLLAYAIGKPSEAFGKPYEVFDRDRIIARLPGPPYFFMDCVKKIDHKAWDLKPGGWIEAEYNVPADDWYFRANRSSMMPFCVLLEIALQPCGWLAAYAGSALRSEKQLKFRNLGGKAILFKEISRDFGKLTMRTRMTKVSEAAGIIIQDFDIQILKDGEMIYNGMTNFGFFTNETMEQQVGIRNPEKIIYKPSEAELSRAIAVDFPNEAPLTPDDMNNSPHSSAAMPSKALMMIDGVECYIPDGGPSSLGYVRGYKIVDPDEWFFKAHFYQDPVCPGSLGIESFIQLIKFAALDRYANLKDTHILEFVTGTENEWLYRGQVVPKNKKVEVTAVITGIKEGESPEITADGYLTVDGLLIYQMKNFGLKLSPQKK